MLALALWVALSVPSSGGDLDEAELRELAQPMDGPADEAALRHLVETMLPRVAKVMKAQAPRDFTLRLVSRKEAADRLRTLLRRDYPGDALERLGLALRAVHLVEPDIDLGKEAESLYGSNVGGFYDPEDKALYLIRDQPMVAQAMIVPHELAHAVQDAQMHLADAVRARRASEDATLALSAAVEGNAQAVASAVLAEAAAGDEGAAMLSMLSEGSAESAQTAALQSGAPPWLGLQLHFPYSAGLKLVAAAQARGDAQGMQLLRRPPESTAQVVAPDLYFREERPLSSPSLRLASKLEGATPLYETTLGRANLDLFGDLHANGVSLGEGWRGDRLEAVRRKGAVMAVWTLAFSTAAQAKRFADAYAQVGPSASVQQQGARVVVLEGIATAQQAPVRAAALELFP